VAGFAIDFPSAYPVAAYSIAQGDVVDLAAKNQPGERAAQHLRECLQGPFAPDSLFQAAARRT
jgi:phosphotransferase system HPr-like phosphotransfer protein